MTTDRAKRRVLGDVEIVNSENIFLVEDGYNNNNSHNHSHNSSNNAVVVIGSSSGIPDVATVKDANGTDDDGTTRRRDCCCRAKGECIREGAAAVRQKQQPTLRQDEKEEEERPNDRDEDNGDNNDEEDDALRPPTWLFGEKDDDDDDGIDEEEEEEGGTGVGENARQNAPKTVVTVLELTDTVHLEWIDDEITGGYELGCRLWRASAMLSNYVRNRPALVRNKRVLEVGAGMGLVGYTASALGARHVAICDCGTETLRQLRRILDVYKTKYGHQRETTSNTTSTTTPSTTTSPSSWDAMNVSIRRHLWEEDMEYAESKRERRPMDRVYHWSKHGEEGSAAATATATAPTLDYEEERFDVILASDVLYFTNQERPLLAAIDLRLSKSDPGGGGGGGAAYILQTMRTVNVEIFKRFVAAARSEPYRFAVTVVDDIRPSDDEFSIPSTEETASRADQFSSTNDTNDQRVPAISENHNSTGIRERLVYNRNTNETLHATGYKLLILRRQGG